MHHFILFFSLFFSCQTFASLKEAVGLYERDQFLPKSAMSFELEVSELTLPISTSQKELVRAMVENDQKLMFYLSENKKLSANKKLFHRLQAFQYVLAHDNEELGGENEKNLRPLFKFTGGNWIRLQGVVWGNGNLLSFMTLTSRKINKGRVAGLSLKYMSCFDLLYYRFLSNKERQLQDKEIIFAPRDQKESKDRAPKPRSLRREKYNKRYENYR